MMLGDNIYRRDSETGGWHQADSHHSLPDGTPDPDNVARDTGTDRVLISRTFVYFGRSAPKVPDEILTSMGFSNGRGHRTFTASEATDLLAWLHDSYGSQFGLVVADPFEFEASAMRYSTRDNRLR